MKLYEIRRSDGQRVPRFAFSTRAEAQEAINQMSEPERQPFTYRVVEVETLEDESRAE